MKTRKVISKGYTITVDSYEIFEGELNFEHTVVMVVDTLEEVKFQWSIIELAQTLELEGCEYPLNKTDKQLICEFVNINMSEKLAKDIDMKIHEDYVIDIYKDELYKLLWHPVNEEYQCRELKSFVVTYSPEDIYVEEIEIN